MNARLPNFIYIGPSKAGSTWLHEALILHPDIYMSLAKDLYFFDRYFDRGLAWYTAQFAGADPHSRIVGEVCQEYLSSPVAPSRMHSCLGSDLRLMLTVREPAERAFSAYLYLLKHGRFTGTFREALESRPGLLDHARYGKLVNGYLEVFPASAIYCGVFDDLVDDPQRFLDGVLDWLQVAPMTLTEALLAPRLPASRARLLPLARAAKQSANWARDHGAAQLIGRIKRSPVVQAALYQALGDDKPTMLDEDAHYVRERLVDDIVQIEEIFGLQLRRRWGWLE